MLEDEPCNVPMSAQCSINVQVQPYLRLPPRTWTKNAHLPAQNYAPAGRVGSESAEARGTGNIPAKRRVSELRTGSRAEGERRRCKGSTESRCANTHSDGARV